MNTLITKSNKTYWLCNQEYDCICEYNPYKLRIGCKEKSINCIPGYEHTLIYDPFNYNIKCLGCVDMCVVEDLEDNGKIICPVIPNYLFKRKDL